MVNDTCRVRCVCADQVAYFTCLCAMGLGLKCVAGYSYAWRWRRVLSSVPY